MNEEISAKNTKKQILDAYNELLSSHKALKKEKLSYSEEPISIHKYDKTSKVGKKEDIFSLIDDLSVKFNSDMDTFREKIKNSFAVLENLNEEISDKKAYLKDVQNISSEADSLFALIDLQNQKKQEFDKEMELKKREHEWKMEDWKYNFEQMKKIEEFKWESSKDEKENKFYKDLDEKKEKLEKDLKNKEDEFNTKIETKEKYMSQREEEINIKFEQYDNLLKENDKLKNDLENISTVLEKELENKLKKDFENEKLILKKDFELKKNVLEVELTNANKSVLDLKSQIQSLQKSLNESAKKVENLAEKVISWSRPMIINGGSVGNKHNISSENS